MTLPTVIGPTATRTRTGLRPLTAQMVRDAKVYNRKAVSYGWRETETDTFYNTVLNQTTTGLPVQVADRGERGGRQRAQVQLEPVRGQLRQVAGPDRRDHHHHPGLPQRRGHPDRGTAQ
ncbi:hypothetical protein ACFQ2M_18940 [Kitasatospora saccharophila]|uniref:hypothetical protein n=1 Tax=Kitasatospora saccharophila TaxID=407973 RepID=UPI00363A0CC2